MKRRVKTLLLAVLIIVVVGLSLVTYANATLVYDYVDNNVSDVDASPDKGTHSNFTAQQYGPDSIYDPLTEEDTGGGAIAIAKAGADTSGTGTALTLSFSHTLVAGSNRLVVVCIGIENGGTIDVDSVTYGGVAMAKAVEGITGTSGYRFLAEIWYILENDLPSDGSKTVQISCSGTVTSLEINGFCAEYTGVNQGVPEATDNTDEPSPADATIENTISPSDDSWVVSIAGCGNSGSFTHGEGQVEVLDFGDSSSTFAVAELRGASGETSLSSTYSATANRLERVAAAWNGIVEENYELDLEVQWTNASYTLPNEELCIYGGTMGSENIQVDVWTGSAWQNLLTDLSSGWNNVSVTDYLVASTFTIRFKGEMETGDTSQDSWQIDSTLLHTWGIPPVANFSFLPLTPYTGETVTFNASASYDPDGTIVSYFWDFGDGTNATGEIATHAYADDGTYTVTLNVTDNDGLSDTTSADVTVLNRPPVATFTESATTVPTGTMIYFDASDSYDPDGYIVSYFWDFGDGTNATGVVVDHAYVDDGVYTVTLTVTDDDGANDTATSTKTILNRPPVASFTESAETVLTGETITFNASASYDPDGTIVSYFWDFGDGTNGTGVIVDHAYADDGNYTVTLTVTDDDGATDTASSTKTVFNRSPVAIFTESAETVYTGEVITFNASASYDPDGSIVSYFWEFGDGTNATGMIVTYAYAEDGSYTVTLTVTDDDGATDTAPSTKTVLNRLPVAIFTESAEAVLVDEVIYFNASDSYDSDGIIASYFWDFGDATNATGVTTEHVYSSSGVYTVTLTVTDNDGATDTATATKTVEVTPPVAIFAESAETVLTGEVIYFNASDSYDPDGYIASYFWDFGDGTNATGVTAQHAYADDGNYTVILIVTDNHGATDTATAIKTVLNRPPVAIFTESAETVYTGEVITFNASASYDPDGSIVSYFWDFGDGTNATGMIVDHSYTGDGNYTGALIVTDDDGATDSTSSTKTILNRPPVALFTESATTVLTGEVIYFNASDSYDPDGTLVSYFWDFGDGTNATGVIVNHAYVDDGVYTVTLTVTDDDGATASTSATKNVLNRYPVAAFTESATTVLTGEVIYFNASDSYDPDGTLVSYFWDFGDETNATGVTAEHAYADDGVYAVTLTVTDDDGATDSTSSTKTILNRPPVASFIESATTVLTGEVIYFNASGSYDPDGVISSYFWDFGDGTNATGVVVDHAYVDDGVYTVTLTVTDDDGATDTAASTKTVLNRPPVASFTESAETVDTGETITFNASTSYDPDGTIVSYFWDFGDGTNGTGVTVDHAYADDGTYAVTLTVTDDDDAIDTSTSTKTVLNRLPVATFTESAETVYTGETITFNASASYDLDGYVVGYFWNFGDGTNATGVVVEHAYADDGTYTATLTVTDDDGATDTATSTKTVLNRSPVAIFTESATTVLTGETIYFNASASYDPDGYIVSYLWNFGDGTNATGVVVDHVYADDGNYTVILTVTDDDGATDIATSTKTVLNRSPVASFTESAEAVLTDEVIYFNASASYDPDGMIVSYFWDFGDGANATGVIVNHAYVDDGVYTVTLTVTDDDGATGTATATKTVYYLPPDVAVLSVVPSTTEAYPTWVVPLNVTVVVENQGATTETFSVTAYYNETAIETKTVTLNAGENTTRIFSWDVTGIAEGIYTIRAEASIVPGETDTADNTLTNGIVKMNPPGDANDDGIVDGWDLAILGKAWQTSVGDPDYDSRADFNGDGAVDEQDVEILQLYWP